MCGIIFVCIQFGCEELECCLDVEWFSVGNGFSVSVDGKDLFVVMVVSDGVDIGVMWLFECLFVLFFVFFKLLLFKGNGFL